MENKSRNMIISFALSIAFWWWMVGSLNMAVAILLLIFVHEMGHYLAARQKNIAVSLPLFMGPLGALINMESQPQSAKDEAYVGFAGPLLGTVGGIAAMIIGYKLGVSELIAVAVWALWLNLFNLIPLAPLDGGRISMAIDRRMWIIGLPMIAYMLFTSPAASFGTVVLILVLMNAWADIQARQIQAAQSPAYFDVGFKVRVGYALAYVVLGAFLLWAVTNPYGLLAVLGGLGL